jgi:hypothetical protein
MTDQELQQLFAKQEGLLATQAQTTQMLITAITQLATELKQDRDERQTQIAAFSQIVGVLTSLVMEISRFGAQMDATNQRQGDQMKMLQQLTIVQQMMVQALTQASQILTQAAEALKK